MEQRIFSLGLSVEAVSLYLILDSLALAGEAVAREAWAGRWVAGEDILDRAAQELVRRGVAELRGPGLALRPAGEWRGADAG